VDRLELEDFGQYPPLANS